MQENDSPSFPPPGDLFTVWWDLTQTFKRHVTPVLAREHQVDFKDFMALNAIARGALYPGVLCERLSLTPSNASRVIDDLVKHGLVERQLDAADSRRVRLRLTEGGSQVLESARHTMMALMDRGLSGLGAEQVGVFVDVMRHVTARLDGSAPHKASA